MKVLVCLLLMASLFCSCGQKNNTNHSVATEDSVVTKTYYNRSRDWHEFMQRINEPDFETLNKEAYRLMYGSRNVGSNFIFRIVVETPLPTLTSKYVVSKGNPYLINNKRFIADRDTVLRQTVQTFSTRQIDSLKSLLRSSYYWAMKRNAMYNWNDSHGWDDEYFESNSIAGEKDSLIYRTIYFPGGAMGGSVFRSIWDFLEKESKLYNEMVKKDAK